MRNKIVPLAVAALALAAGACSGETIARPPPAPVDWQSFARPAPDAGASSPTAQESVVAQQYGAALASPGFSLLGHLLSEDAHFTFPGARLDDVHGRDAVVQAHATLFGAFEPRRFVASRLLRTPSAQSLEWTMTGTLTRDWMGVAATQKPVVIRGITLLWTKDDGTLSDLHVYFDVAAVKAQLGAGPRELEGLPAPAVSTGPTAVVDAGMTGTENVATVRTALAALENLSDSAYVDTMADDVEVDVLDRAEPARGKEEQRAYFKATHKAIAQLDTSIDNTFAAGPYAVVEYSITGEQLAPIGWVPLQRDRVVRLHVVDVTEVQNAKIARVWRYDNPSEMATPGP
jgi:SnoaL-like domain/SnoaL-like polyketide cyclase